MKRSTKILTIPEEPQLRTDKRAKSKKPIGSDAEDENNKGVISILDDEELLNYLIKS